ncbi:hypothetical protein PQR75_30635 [Paraburkholderia fungorum]|uniref:hypothetical protein n=1 Tax=Paraburkholderia fungorum TaxID=134537 RepID=UPI0038B8E161
MTRPADIYLRFLQLTDALRGLPSLPSLDPLEERILALVARASQTRERLSVRDMMAKSELGSPAMLHARRGRHRTFRRHLWACSEGLIAIARLAMHTAATTLPCADCG